MKKYSKMLAMTLVLLGAWVVLGSSDKVFAANKVWDGTDCTASSDCDWSTAGNWVGGVAPVDGDSVTIEGDTSVDSNTEMDIVGLNLIGITTSGYTPDASGDGDVTIRITAGGGLSVQGEITHNVATDPAPSGYTKQKTLSLSGPLILDGDTATTDVLLQYETDGDDLNLNGHAFTYQLTEGSTGDTTAIRLQITGTGTLNVNIPTDVVLFLRSDNNYSGETNLNSLDYVTGISNVNPSFGTSDINVGPSARILFQANSGTISINNNITLDPPLVTGTFLNNQLEFWTNSGAVTYNVPNITLLGNARLGTLHNTGSVSVNLTGMATNGYCIQYGDNNDDANDFSGGPDACTVNVGEQNDDPNAPDTGLMNITSNSALLGAIVLVISGALFFASRKLRFNN